jgi:Ribonuclease G/E
VPSELLIATGPGEWRAAWLEEGTAVELYVERGDVRLAGSIHLGRIVRRAPGLDSAFVEIGDERLGLLPLRETIADGIRADEGVRIIVQVRREAQQGKGARLSTRVRLPLALDAAALAADASNFDPPHQLYPQPGLAAALALRVPASPALLLTDDPASVPELRLAFPAAEIEPIVPDEWPVDIDAAIEAALSPSVPLAGGGIVHVQPTRAAVLIDVDTGTPLTGSAEAGAVAANLDAAQQIARQLRLRNIGGGIVIDFVGLDGRKARDRVRQALEQALQGDPARPEVLGWTRLGHLEVVRPRHGRPLADALIDSDLPTPMKHASAVAHEALRTLWKQARAQPGANWRLVVAPRVRDALAGPANEALCILEARLGRRVEIALAVNPTRDFDIAAFVSRYPGHE